MVSRYCIFHRYLWNVVGILMKNDPDIIRLSQIKRFLKHTFGWMAIYAFFGWLIDATQYSEQSTTTHIMMLVGLSVLMAFVTYKA